MISITVDTAALTKGLSDLAREQVPFAMSRALNNTADAVQTAVRNSLPANFALRRTSFFNLLVKIDNADRAKKDRLEVTVKVAPPKSGRTAADILSKFEAGGEQVSIKGKQFVPFPGKDIRGKGTKVPRALKWSRFAPLSEVTLLGQLQHRGGINGSVRRATRLAPSKPRLVGQQPGTFVVTLTKPGKAKGRMALMQRVDDTVRLLYVLVPSIHVPERLHFIETATPLVPKLLPYFFVGELERAIATAKPRG